MTDAELKRFDRPDENFVAPKAPAHVVVEEHMRGSFDLGRDGSQHRRYTSFYNDLQN